MGKRWFTIWISGYQTNGDYSPARIVGRGYGKDFDEALEDFKKNNPTFFPWACTYHEHEADARMTFG